MLLQDLRITHAARERIAGVICALVLALVAWHAPPARAAIDQGTITVGRGAGGARLDMSRDQVIAELGAPVRENANGVMSYQPDLESATSLFDIYRHGDTGRVRMFILAGFRGGGWKLRDGNAIFARGAIDRLYRHYGRRVRREHDRVIGERRYVIRSRYLDRPVETQFLVDRFSRKKARVLDVIILFTDRGA